MVYSLLDPRGLTSSGIRLLYNLSRSYNHALQPPACKVPLHKPTIDHITTQYGLATTKFNPAKHLAFTSPSEITTMKQMGYPNDIRVSPVAVSQPF
jgi:hypothetical protein